MLKEVFASNIAKLVAACVCPVVGASAIALKVPPVRQALHKATEPKPKREARAKPRVRTPVKNGAEKQAGVEQTAMLQDTALMCSQPLKFDDSPLQSPSLNAPVSMTVQLEPALRRMDFSPSNCPVIRLPGGGIMGRFAAIPEPATWVQMVAGFALMGGMVRAGRRRGAGLRPT